MAPSIYRRTGDDTFSTHTTTQPETREAAGQGMSPWLIVIIVLGALVVTTLVVFLARYLVRRRRRIAQDGQKDPLGLEDFRKRRMSTSDRLAAEEMERATMIRKSLASRASSWSGISFQAPETSEYQLEEFEREEQEPQEPVAPRVNWKEVEAGTQDQRATTGLVDTEIGVHPALLPQPQLAIPQPSRAPSPIRGIQPPQLIIPS
ncbi:hypothetical protein F4821DRAFT_242897 [Hypoxylon rubiginosum]|uniref:Uncharacterized protein n=1 Tax=Hypoxylon rubiginosum TaxID=110542 RepID=A0ACC0CWH4_9PEZI|nr:hypothetical protein F4821DRAFT_242897 [Hypoxylon rubiginosum]